MSKKETITILVVGFVISGFLGVILTYITEEGDIVGLVVMIIGILETIYFAKRFKKTWKFLIHKKRRVILYSEPIMFFPWLGVLLWFFHPFLLENHLLHPEGKFPPLVYQLQNILFCAPWENDSVQRYNDIEHYLFFWKFLFNLI